MKKDCSESLLKKKIKDFHIKMAPMWQKLIFSILEETEKSYKNEWFEDLIRLTLGSNFEIEKENTKNGMLLWIDNLYTTHLQSAICFYLPLEQPSSLFYRKQEAYYFWGTLLALNVIQRSKKASYCRVFWVLENRLATNSSVSLFTQQKLSLKEKKCSVLVFEKDLKKGDNQTCGNQFLNCTDPDLILSIETETVQSFIRHGHKTIGCQLRDTLSTTEEQDTLYLPKAERIGMFLIRMLSGLNRT